jgi:hypothetical protein
VPKRVSVKGKGAELFFGDFPEVAAAEPLPAPPAPLDGELGEAATLPDAALSEDSGAEPAADAAPVPREAPAKASRRPARANRHARTPDGDLPRSLASVDASTVETIRQVIKVPGREVSYLRLTPEEKAVLTDIVYTYKRQGQKTSETEINRIALNYLLLDYRENGQQSVLARVLAALLA